jgi:hypothetical protein
VVLFILLNPSDLISKEYYAPQSQLFSLKPAEVYVEKIVPADCSCVEYAKAKSGINIGRSIKVAKNHPINSATPIEGAIGVIGTGQAGHLFVVTAIKGDMIEINESNYEPCKITTRLIPINAEYIKGYYYE